MIIARSPLRITLGGGGTDLASYYEDHEGFLIAAAIDKYVYVTVMRPFTEGIYLKYSQLEQVEKIAQVQHPIIREALNLMGLRTPQVEITTLAAQRTASRFAPHIVFMACESAPRNTGIISGTCARKPRGRTGLRSSSGGDLWCSCRRA